MVVTASLFSRALDPFALTHWKNPLISNCGKKLRTWPNVRSYFVTTYYCIYTPTYKSWNRINYSSIPTNQTRYL